MICTRGLSVSSLSILLPLNPLSPRYPGPVCCSITPGTILRASPQGLLITEHFPGLHWPPYPHQSLSSHDSSRPGIGFSLVFIVCLPPRRILFIFIFIYIYIYIYFKQRFPYTKHMLSEPKGYILINISR